jgi:predicted DNA-binding protein (UPF0278 family)
MGIYKTIKEREPMNNTITEAIRNLRAEARTHYKQTILDEMDDEDLIIFCLGFAKANLDNDTSWVEEIA